MIEVAIMEIVKTGTVTLFLGMIAFPSLILKKIDSWFYNEPELPPVNSFDPTLTIQMNPTPENIDSELMVLERLNKARDNAKNPEAKQMWEIKKAEYLRKLKWRQLEEIAHASERVA